MLNLPNCKVNIRVRSSDISAQGNTDAVLGAGFAFVNPTLPGPRPPLISLVSSSSSDGACPLSEPFQMMSDGRKESSNSSSATVQFSEAIHIHAPNKCLTSKSDDRKNANTSHLRMYVKSSRAEETEEAVSSIDQTFDISCEFTVSNMDSPDILAFHPSASDRESVLGWLAVGSHSSNIVHIVSVDNSSIQQPSAHKVKMRLVHSIELAPKVRHKNYRPCTKVSFLGRI